MSSIDERTVKMRFDNAGFKKAATETQGSLAAVDAAVAKTGKGRGLLDMAGHMDTVRVKASAMQIAVVTALANVVTKAVDAGLRLGKALTLDPLTQGFNEYELKIKSIQTILANTKGETLKTVTGYLEKLNVYADKTIYNFAQMTTAIGKMTTAGIQLDTATEVVKGFHNMVALAGGDATAAAQAMEQFVYGLQAGKITALDWQSIATRGLGSQSLQKAFFETARAAGTLEGVGVDTTFEEWAKSVGGFKGSLESGWLTSKVATDALSIMTGDVKDVQELMKMGFSKQTAEDMLDIAAKAVDAATKVRTMTAFFGTLKEQVGSGFSQVFEVIFGDIDEATKTFTKLSDATGRIVGNIFDYLTKLAQGWEDFGGRTAVLQTFKNLLAPIGAILGVIAKGWKKAFGDGEAGRGISTFMKAIQHITRPLRILGKLISGQLTPLEAWERLITVVKNAVRNFYNFLGGQARFDKILGDVPSGASVLTFIKEFLGEVKEAIGQVRELVDGTKKIGDVVSGFDIPDLGGMFGGDDNKILGLASGLGKSVKSFDPGAAAKEAQGGMFNPTAKIDAGRVSDIPAGPDGTSLTSYAADLNEGVDKVEAASGRATNVVGSFIGWLKDFFAGVNFDDLVASFNIAVFSVFVINLSNVLKAFSDGLAAFGGLGGAFGTAMTNISEALQGFAKAAQREAMAKIILNIAIALAILVGAVWLLSKIPQAQLTKAIFALAAIMVVLRIALDGFAEAVEKMNGKSLQMVGLGFGMIALAISISILASAMKKMNDVDWASVLKAAIAIELMTRAMGKLAEMDKEGLLKASFAMIIVAGALLVFAIAIRKFAQLDFKTFAEGLAYASVALLALVTIMNKFTSSVGGAIALVIVVGALWLLVDVIKKFAELNFKTFAEGMTYIGIALGTLAFIMKGFTSSLLGAAALYVVMFALEKLYGVILLFSNLDWGTFLKGLAMLAIGLVVVGGGLALLSLVAGPIALLAGALALLAFGLTALTLAFALILPILAAGAGAFAAFATGAAIAFAVFLTTLAAEAPIIKKAMLDILQVIIDTIVEAVPMVIQGFKDLWAAIKAEFQSDEKKGLMGDTGKSWIDKLKDGVKKKVPEIVKGAIEIGKKFLDGLIKNAGQLAAKGATFVTNIIKGIASKIGGIVDAAADLLVKFAEGLGNNLGKIVKAGIKLIADWLHALADGIRNGSAAIGGGLKDVLDAIKDVGVNIVKGLIEGVKEMAGDAIAAIGDLAGDMVNKAKGILDIFSPSRVFKNIGKFIVEGLTNGIQDNAVSAITAVASMVSGQIAVASQYVNEFVQKLDQQAIAASAKAAGLADAAEEARRSADKAARAAEKTKKNKKDDRKARKAQNEAEKLGDRAEAAGKKAERAEAKVDKAIAAEERAQEFEKADLLTKAQMRSEDAQMSMDEAKQHEFQAARNLAAAEALEKQAGAKGVSKKDANAMKKEAERLKKLAKGQAAKANAAIEAARNFASSALSLQTAAGDEAALNFQEQYDQEAADDAAGDAFDKLTDAEKAVKRREEAAALQQKADKQLADAKLLAYTDLEAANDLAAEAMTNAQKARDYLDQAEDFDEKAKGGTGTSAATTGGRVVNTAITDAAGLAMQRANDRYTGATAAAATTPTVEFNQYNSSPEALNPSEIYRRTHGVLPILGEIVEAA